jgi:hypothetical protein
MVTATWNDVARTKLVRILGVTEGEAMFQETMRLLGVSTLTSPDDLYDFANLLKKGRPVVAAIGAMLSLNAVMNGATVDREISVR